MARARHYRQDENVVACAVTPEGKEIRTFQTMTDDWVSMAEWITKLGCTHVAMESTASYWKPIYNLLELQDLQILVVNAKHIGNNENAGKRKSGKTRKGHQKLRMALVEAARAAARTKNTTCHRSTTASQADAVQTVRPLPWRIVF